MSSPPSRESAHSFDVLLNELGDDESLFRDLAIYSPTLRWRGVLELVCELRQIVHDFHTTQLRMDPRP